MIKKYLPQLVLVAAIAQIAVAYWFATQGFFNEQTDLRLFIQPAGYAFSIWGLIYTLASAYAVYQVIPSKNNPVMKQNRIYALVLFVGSSAWLWASNLSADWLWVTVPILLAMGYVGFKAVTVSAINIGSKRISTQDFLSYQCLTVYAAWTNIAMFVNIGAMATQYKLFQPGTTWLMINVILLAVVFIWIYKQFVQLRYSVWYGFIAVWSLIGVFVVNGDAQGSKIIMYCAAVLTIPFVLQMLRRTISVMQNYQITIKQK